MAEISTTGDQMLVVLETVAERGPLTATAVSQVLDLNRTVAHRLLTTLHERAYVRRDSKGRYLVGPMIARLSRGDETGFLGPVISITKQLSEKTGESSVVHILDGDQAVVLHAHQGDRHLVRVSHDVGSHHSLSKGASGRAILAFAPETSQKRVISRSADPVLERRLAEVRALGYAVSHDELQAGVHGIAVPIREDGTTATASLALVVPATRSESIIDWLDDLIDARDEIERLIEL